MEKSISKGNIKSRIDEIRKLEEKVVNLKKSFVLESSSAFEDGIFSEPSFLLIGVKKKIFAAPLHHIDEVLEIPFIDELADRVNCIAGMVNYHGELIAVIDVEELSTKSRSYINSYQMLVICTAGDHRFALKVDEALEVVTASSDDITVSDEILPGILNSSGLLKTKVLGTVSIIDLIWISAGIHLNAVLRTDSVIPREY
jgi:chemotaxis signal transduction protein